MTTELKEEVGLSCHWYFAAPVTGSHSKTAVAGRTVRPASGAESVGGSRVSVNVLIGDEDQAPRFPWASIARTLQAYWPADRPTRGEVAENSVSPEKASTMGSEKFVSPLGEICTS